MLSIGLVANSFGAAAPISDSEFSAAFDAVRQAALGARLTAASVPDVAAAPVRGHADEVLDAFRRLPGSVSFQLCRLGPTPQVLHELNPDVSLAIGSAFKLYILAALSEDQKPWSEILSIRQDLLSLPSGLLHRALPGSPMTVYGLAALMLSISDNTATDHLLHHAGRSRVEQMMSLAGNALPGRSVPFLATLEMFKLKSDPALMSKYIAADEATRRALLDTEVRAIQRDEVARRLSDWKDPIAIDAIEWFASASDLCRLMNHFRQKNDAAALGLMAINPGLRFDDKVFSYVGFKGGSEPGVINLTFLLKTVEGESYALSAGWNDPCKEVDLGLFVGLVQKVINTIGSPGNNTAALSFRSFSSLN
jgi:beta-lactamase class A